MSKRLPSLSNWHPDTASAVARPNLDRQFDIFLKSLNAVEDAHSEQLEAELERNYREWSAAFSLLKEHFSEAWELFGGVERDVTGWKRESAGSGTWGYLGSGRHGYNFGVTIRRADEQGCWTSSKWLSVTLGCLGDGRRGIGDERLLGRRGKITDALAGLDGCYAQSIATQVAASRQLLTMLREQRLVFILNGKERRQMREELGLEALGRYRLKEMCQSLFVALNKDEVIEFSKHLPMVV